MKKSIFFGIVLLGIVAVILITSSMQVAAQGPTNLYPSSATYMDLQWHTIPANSELWYIFDYAGDRSMIELVLTEGYTNKLAFNIYIPEAVRQPDQIGTPIGRGSAPSVSCDSGTCTQNDLIWKGNFTGPGTYYVQVVNSNPKAITFLLKISGSGVILYPSTPTSTVTVLRTATHTPPSANLLQTAVSAAVLTLTTQGTTTITPTVQLTVSASVTVTIQVTNTPSAIELPTNTPTLTAPSTITATSTPSPTITTTPTPDNLYSNNAIYVLDNRTRTIPEYSELWFKFDYAGDRSQMIILIPGGNDKHLAFRVYTPEEMTLLVQENEEREYIGEGTAPLIPCDAGKCPSNDLLYNGSSSNGGTYYLRIINNNPKATTFQIWMSGTGLVLGR